MSAVSAIYYDIRLRESGLRGDFFRARSMLSDMFHSLGAMAQASISARVLNTIVQAPREMAESIFELGRSVQFSRAAFDTMLGDVNRGGIMLQQLRDYARDFSLPVADVLRFGQQILAMGFSAEQAVPVLHRMAEAASISPVGIREMMSRLTLAVGQIRAAGFLRGQELRQLTEAGIPVLDIMRNKLGKTTAEIQDMMRNSQLDAATFLNALFTGLDERIGGILQKRQATFFGSLEVMRAAWENLFANMGDVMGKQLAVTDTGFFKSDAWTELSDIIISSFSGAIRLAIGLGTDFRNILLIIGEEIGRMVGPFAGVQAAASGWIDTILQSSINLVNLIDHNRAFIRDLLVIGTTVVGVVAGFAAFYAALGAVAAGFVLIINPITIATAAIMAFIGLATSTEDNWLGVLTNLGLVIYEWPLVWNIAMKAIEIGWNTLMDNLGNIVANWGILVHASIAAIGAGFEELFKQLHGGAGDLRMYFSIWISGFKTILTLLGAFTDTMLQALDSWSQMAGIKFGDVNFGGIGQKMGEAFNEAVAAHGGFRFNESELTKRLKEERAAMAEQLANSKLPGLGGGGADFVLRRPQAPGLPQFPPGDVLAEEEKKKAAKEKGFEHVGFVEFSRRLQESLAGATALQVQKQQLTEQKKGNEHLARVAELAKWNQEALKDIGKKLGLKP